jgi:hypothetical protein
MVTTRAVYQPELINLMKCALDDAATIWPKSKRTSAMKVKVGIAYPRSGGKGRT